ncbi:MAG: ATP-binding protein [Colwellia sp.]|nr:ATP-binding protein [Colwellia sp.]
MILRFGGSNFFCFKEYFEIDLRLNKNCPKDISLGNDFSQVLCIKGQNAAGKTNALKAISFLASFITESFDDKPESIVQIETYFNNDEPIKLFCEFRIGENDFRYDLELHLGVILNETFTDLKSNECIISRKDKSIDFTINKFDDLKTIPQLRANASLISTANQFQTKSIVNIYTFFRIGMYSNVNNYGFQEVASISKISKFYKDNPECLDFVTSLLSKYDTGIKSIKIDDYVNTEGKEVYLPTFIYSIDNQNKPLRYIHQSSGTKRLYKILGWFYLMTRERNEIFDFYHVMFIDELDLHLHSKILQELINLFQNNNKTQLVFTCQNDEIMNKMGKYRTVLIGKDDNESFSYRLDELPSDLLRNSRPITPHYRKGSIGGVPNIGE